MQNQHAVQGNDTMEELRQAVCQTGTTLLILDPWDEPVTFTRVWCLFEALWTLIEGSALEVMFPQSEREVVLCMHFTSLLLRWLPWQAFAAALMDEERSDFRVITALSKLDVRTATATVKSDIAMIFKMIEDSVGFHELNTQVTDALRKQIAANTVKMAQSRVETEVRFGWRAARLLRTLGDTATAKTILPSIEASDGDTRRSKLLMNFMCVLFRSWCQDGSRRALHLE